MAKKKLKDTDYLFISTYLRSREKNLLTAARMERMIDAPSADEAGKVLQEIGYGEFSATSDRELGQALAREPGGPCSRTCTAMSPTRRWWMCSRSSMTTTTSRPC